MPALNDINIIFRDTMRSMVGELSDAVLVDIQDIFVNEEMFDSPEPPIGAGLMPVLELSNKRIGVKTAWGYLVPSKPRVASEKLFDSIDAVVIDDTSAQVFTDNEAAETQQKGGGAWVDEFGSAAKHTPARPFFGVSDRALGKVNKSVEQFGEQLVRELDGLTAVSRFTINIENV